MYYQPLTRFAPEFREKKRAKHIFHSQFSVFSSPGGGLPPTNYSVACSARSENIWSRVPRVAAETALPWAIIFVPFGDRASAYESSFGLSFPFSIVRSGSRPLRFQNRGRKRKERKGGAEFAKGRKPPQIHESYFKT